MIKSYDISTLDKLSSVALELLSLTDNRIFALYGGLGVGKTTLVKYMCNHLKVVDSVSSPTFSIVNEYSNETSNPIFHFDFYRLDNIEAARKIGFDVYLNSNAYCFIEWPNLIESYLPCKHHAIKLEEVQDKRQLLVLK
ncbi:MAG: tRNA (adenosine(37)-N6)-threonylcarbamoyltransferase complex ATPase subunit type 1 TsaE [Flavobacteriales bacterium]|nr:tRNA (adenosine(37)-N6)-threonylcarbamoyltransferase complex ATPase subunit type 1 TsaE [Flavobacteriales bacterium]|tara:strand:- start:1363 stop:1779 length:417 start_codon:yes stop_codon:yes gene_type:complete